MNTDATSTTNKKITNFAMNSKEIQGLIEYVENPDNRMQDGYHVTDVEMLNIVMNKLKRLVKNTEQ